MLVAFFQVEMMATVAESVDYLSEVILNKCKRDQCWRLLYVLIFTDRLLRMLY